MSNEAMLEYRSAS